MRKLDPSERLMRYLRGCFDNAMDASDESWGGIVIDLTGMSQGSTEVNCSDAVLLVSKDDHENHMFYIVEYADSDGYFETLGDKFCLRDLKTALPRFIAEYTPSKDWLQRAA